MRLARLETTGLRGLHDAAFDVEPDRSAPGHATVVTGPPQVGLTTFLDAVALSAARLAPDAAAADPADVVRAGGAAALIRTTWWLDADERAFGGLVEETADAEIVFQRGGLGRAIADPGLLGVMARYDHSPSLSKVASIPARRVVDGGVPTLGDFESDQRFKRLSPEPSKFVGAAHALVKHASGLGELARFDEVQRIFRELCGSVQLRGVGAAGHLEFALASGAGVPSIASASASATPSCWRRCRCSSAWAGRSSCSTRPSWGSRRAWPRAGSRCSAPPRPPRSGSSRRAIPPWWPAWSRRRGSSSPHPRARGGRLERAHLRHGRLHDHAALGFRDRTVNALEWTLEGGDRVGLVVQREQLPRPEGEAAPRPGALERFVAEQTRDYPTRFSGFHLDNEEVTAADSSFEMRRKAFRWRHEQEVLYHHQAFVLADFTVLVFTTSAKARHREAVDRLLHEVLAELRVRGS